MANRITGLSGMDTESMVQSLMKGHLEKVNKVYRERIAVTWKKEMYQGLTTQMNAFQSKFLSFTQPATNLKSGGFFASKTYSIKTSSTGADSTGVTIKNASSTKNADFTIAVKQLAQAQKMSGNVSSNPSAYTKSITSGAIDLDNLHAGQSITLDLDGKKVTANVTQEMTQSLSALASGLDTQFKAFGTGTDDTTDKVNVRLDNNKLVFETQAGRTLKVSSSNNDMSAAQTFNTPTALGGTPYDIKFSLTVGGETVNLTVNTADIAATDGVKNSTGLAAKLQAALAATGKFQAGDINFTASEDGSSFSITTKEGMDPVTFKENITGLQTGQAVTNGSAFTVGNLTDSVFGITAGTSTDNPSSNSVGSLLGTGNYSQMIITGATGTKSLSELGITANSTTAELMTAINGANLGVKLSYNSNNGSYSFEATKTGKDNGFTLSPSLMTAFKINPSSTSNVQAQDAVFILDGSETSRDTNSFDVQGLTIELNKTSLPAVGQTVGAEIHVKSATDTEKIISGIKSFVDEYNKMLATLNTKYNEPRAKSGSYSYYEPLLDDEKAAMNESDIKLWEEKAKQGLLSRDTAVGKVVDQLRSAMSQSLDLGDGKKISMYDIGIASADWKDQGALQINEDKLRKALEERPDDVAALFNTESKEKISGNRSVRDKTNGIAYRLDDIVNDATKTSPNSKGLYGYFIELAGQEGTAKVSENELSRKIKELNERIAYLEELNLSKENSYYSMFSKMEQAMTQAQNQQKQAGLA